MLLASYAAIVASVAVALLAPFETQGPSCDSVAISDGDVCIELGRFSHSNGLVSIAATLVVAGVIGCVVAWWRWERAQASSIPVPVVNTLHDATQRFRVRYLMLFVAITPLFAALMLRGTTRSTFDSEPVEVCERLDRATDVYVPATIDLDDLVPGDAFSCVTQREELFRTVTEQSPLFAPFLVSGLVLTAGTLAWWVRAWRQNRVNYVSEY